MTGAAAAAPPDGIDWLTDWDAALTVARATRKVILIDVSKDP